MSLSSSSQQDNETIFRYSPSTRRAGSELLSERFVPFNHRATVVEPFDDETKRDAELFESAYMLVLCHCESACGHFSRTQRNAA